MERSSISISDWLSTKLYFERTLISSSNSLRSTSIAMFLCSMPFSSIKNSSERMEISGFLMPAASKISITFSETKAWSITCRMVVSISSSVCPVPLSLNLHSRALTAWKKATSSFTSIAFSFGMAMAKAFPKAVTSLTKRFLPSSRPSTKSSVFSIHESLPDVVSVKYC